MCHSAPTMRPCMQAAPSPPKLTFSERVRAAAAAQELKVQGLHSSVPALTPCRLARAACLPCARRILAWPARTARKLQIREDGLDGSSHLHSRPLCSFPLCRCSSPRQQCRRRSGSSGRMRRQPVWQPASQPQPRLRRSPAGSGSRRRGLRPALQLALQLGPHLRRNRSPAGSRSGRRRLRCPAAHRSSSRGRAARSGLPVLLAAHVRLPWPPRRHPHPVQAAAPKQVHRPSTRNSTC